MLTEQEPKYHKLTSECYIKVYNYKSMELKHAFRVRIRLHTCKYADPNYQAVW